MKRDMELIRKILLAVEDGQSNSSMEGFSDDEVKYHSALAIEAGLVDGAVLRSNTEIPASIMIHKLTMAGHDFVDVIISESNWQRVKEFLKDAGKQVTIETIKAAVSHIFGFSSG